MASTSASTAIDPVSAAKAYTDKYTVDQQALITAQTKAAQDTATGLSTLQTAISTYQASLSTLTGAKTLLTQGVTFSAPGIASATAGPSAVAGSYAFFVESVATNNQVSYGGLSDTPAAGSGSLTLSVGGASFSVDLSAADKDNNGTLTPKEIAAAINAEPHNNSMVTASIITIGGVAQLVLSSNTSGVAGALTLDASAVSNAPLQAALTNPANIKQTVAAQDAVVWLGAQGTGTRIQQGSNTFSNVDGVNITFTRAQAVGEQAVTATVGLDSAATTANAQSFVDSYNKLKTVLDTLTDPGDPQNGVAAGIFSQDSGVRVLRDQMVRTLRETSVGALSTFGITAQRNGTLGLDSARLATALAAKPNGLDLAIGSTAAGSPSAIASKLNTYLNTWSNTGDGQIATRQASVTQLQSSLTARQTKFEADYTATYNRYLAQFTQLQNLQQQMAQNSSMFDALFGTSSKG
ncbi:flagellar hook-associated protein 2 [Oxalobacteraceae bacterium GrIS 1.11]